MPNHVKNRLEIQGSDKDIKLLIEKYSTHFPVTEKRSYDEEIVYKNNKDEYGWYSEKKEIFRYRKNGEILESPEILDGYEIQYEEAWDRFPDFSKIVPMAESLSITSGSMGDMGYEMLTGNWGFLGKQEVLKRFYEMDLDKRIEAIDLGMKYVQNEKLYGHKTWYSWAVENWGTKWNAYSCQGIDENIYEWQTAWGGVPDLIEKMSLEFPEVTLIYEYADEDTGSNCGRIVFRNGLLEESIPESCSREAYELAFKLWPGDREYYVETEDGYEYKEDEE